MGGLVGGRTRLGAGVYWAATGLVVAELAVGGVWDVLRLPVVLDTVSRLGYPAYFLVILGVWKMLGALALVVPGFGRLKEWAYAGVVFADTGAIVSHIWVGFGVGEVVVLVVLLGLTVISWAARPEGRVVRPRLGSAGR